MKELLQSFFKITEDRIKNPFIGAFMTSWLLFNWKPILFLFFSSKNIEQKILYIETSFSDINYIIWLPLLSTIFYVLILPYINLLFDLVLKYSLFKKNISLIEKQTQTIENQKKLAIEEIKLEEAKTEFRERNTHNKLVEELQRKNTVYEDLLNSEKQKNQKLVDDLKQELKKREDITSVEFKNYEKRYNDSRKEMNLLNEKLFEKDKLIQELKYNLNDENLKKNRDSIITFENGLELFESFHGNEVIYSDNDEKRLYSQKEVNELMSKYAYKKYKN